MHCAAFHAGRCGPNEDELDGSQERLGQIGVSLGFELVSNVNAVICWIIPFVGVFCIGNV